MTDQRPAWRPAPGRPRSATPHAVIVGGGASGVLMATHLLSRADARFRVTIIEGRHMLGCGVAYSTSDPDHLLNTRVANMSAFPEDPDHFRRWLAAGPGRADRTGQCFVDRATYGAYMASLLAPWSSGAEARRLRCIRDTCLRLEEKRGGIVAHLDAGPCVIGDLAILATGHPLPEPDPAGVLTGAWDQTLPADPASRVVIIGSGLSMVDRVLSLLKAGHRGEIVAVSRRGLLPQPHEATTPLAVGLGEVPLGAPLSALFRWARALAGQAALRGGTWRDAIDGIRPHVRNIWRGLPPAERARFLRHAVALWDSHRHRMPPASHAVLTAAMERGQLGIVRGAFVDAERRSAAVLGARVALRPSGRIHIIEAGQIIDCRGIRRDPETHASPLVADLLRRGAARLDPLRIGLDVAGDCRIMSREGVSSARLLAVGPASRSAFWEITAIPDIREQTFRLAGQLSEARARASRA